LSRRPALKGTALHPASNPEGKRHPQTPEGSRTFAAFDRAKKRAYLEGLRKYPVIRYACEVARISRQTVLNHRKSDPAFAAAEELARQDGIERLERDVMRRACGEDVERPSDLLSIFVLKALKPELYRDHIDHRVVGQVQHTVTINLVPVTAQDLAAGSPQAGSVGASLPSGPTLDLEPGTDYRSED
jgi:hypothetical protein